MTPVIQEFVTRTMSVSWQNRSTSARTMNIDGRLVTDYRPIALWLYFGNGSPDPFHVFTPLCFALGHCASLLTHIMKGDWRLILQGMVASRPTVWTDRNETRI